jgi:trehalose 6-phosphate synthase
MYEAMHASPAERARRMRSMRRRVIEHDVDLWAKEFLEVLEGGR